MRIWIVTTGYTDQDGDVVLGVYDDEVKADKRIQEFKDNKEGWRLQCEWIGKDDFELNESLPFFPMKDFEES